MNLREASRVSAGESPATRRKGDGVARSVVRSCLVPRGNISFWQQVKQQWVVLIRQIVVFFTNEETHRENHIVVEI